MGYPITSKRGTFYAYLQANGAAVTTFTAPDIATDAIRVIDVEWKREGGPLERDNHDEAHDGGLKPVAGPVTRVCTVRVERRSSVTAGDATTWQQYALWAMCPAVIVDDSGATISLTPTAGRLQGLFGNLGTIAYYERNGARKAAINCYSVPMTTTMEAGGIIVDTFEIRGQPIDVAASTANDRVQIQTYQVTTAGTGAGSFVIKDDTGRSVVGTFTAGASADLTATAIEAAIETARGAATWFTETVSTDTVTVTGGEVGRPITVTITPASGGAGTLTTTQTNYNYSTYPTWVNDSEVPIVFSGGTITHQLGGDDVLNVTKAEFAYGYTIAQKKTGGDASGSGFGFNIPRVSGQVKPVLSISCDQQSALDFDVDGTWSAATAVSCVLANAPNSVTATQGVIMDPSESESDGDRGWDYKIRMYSDGSSTDMWSQTLS